MPRLVAAVTLGLLPTIALAQTADWHRLPLFTGSSQARLVTDTKRERTVLFESGGRNAVSRTWEWHNGSWSLRWTPVSPPPRGAFGLGYDPWRNRVVLFGGMIGHDPRRPGALLDDTWEYDGRRWQQRNPTASPPPQQIAWLGADPVHRRLLACISSAQAGASSWSYDGTTWTASANLPFPTWPADFASDPTRCRIVAVGVGPLGAYPMTFEWDGTTWIINWPLQSPPSGSALSHDPGRAAILAHGAGALWQWDGVNWTTISAQPGAAFDCDSMSHDPSTGRLVLLGSLANGGVRATVEWNGSTWAAPQELVNPNSERNTTWFDHNRGRVVSFPLLDSDWFEWDGTRWHRRATPPGGGASLFAFDAARGRAVGLQSGQANSYRTIEWDGMNWTGPIAAAPPCSAHLVYHSGRGRVLSVCTLGIHEWDGTNWIHVSSGAGTPWIAEISDVAYDPRRDELVACIGSVFSRPQTFTWDGTTWTARTPAASPPPVIDFSMTWDPVRERVVLFGGRARIASSNDWINRDELWEWDGTTWSQRILPNRPPARFMPGLAFDPVRSQLVMSGGLRLDPSSPLRLADTWALDSQTRAAVTRLGPGCPSSGNAPELVASHPYPGAPAFSIDLAGARPNTPTLMAFSLAPLRTLLPGNCVSYVPAPALVVSAVTNASGQAGTTTSLPAGLIGSSFGVQAAALDPTNPRGVALTDGIRITIGN